LPSSSEAPRAVGYYSLLSYVPDPIRGEFINIGLFLVDREGRWARFEATTPRGAIRSVGSAADVDKIERWVGDLKRQFHVLGDEPLLPAAGRIQPELLADWAAEFGGKLRVSAPTVAVGDRMDAVWTQLYGRLVKRQRRPGVVAAVTSEPRPTASDERREVLYALETEVRGWPNYDPELFRRDHIFRGGAADHIVDVAFMNGQIKGVANVIPVAHGEVVDVIRARSLLEDAALDLEPQVSKLALVEEPPADRAGLLDEVLGVFAEMPEGHTITVIPRREFPGLEARFGGTLFG
jgi:hypothetical protein